MLTGENEAARSTRGFRKVQITAATTTAVAASSQLIVLIIIYNRLTERQESMQGDLLPGNEFSCRLLKITNILNVPVDLIKFINHISLNLALFVYLINQNEKK